MLNKLESLNTEQLSAEALRHLLAQAPDLTIIEDRTESTDAGVDLLLHIDFNGKPHALACEIKASGQPRHVKSALLDLKRYAQSRSEPAIPILIAPYLSEGARALCVEHQVGYLDLQGNARIVFPGFYLLREVAEKPKSERRALRSLFKPKSAQVLRTLLRDPSRTWRVADLSALTQVSAGQVSYVRNGLLDRGWAEVTSDGLCLSHPGALLDAWRDEYAPPAGDRTTYYTTMHGTSLDKALRQLQTELSQDDASAVLASFSAANWLAPFARTGTHHFYADAAGARRLRDTLGLEPASRGENVVVNVLKDTGPLQDMVEPAPGIYTTSPVQTYLDLFASGERGREAAQHLRQELLQWTK